MSEIRVSPPRIFGEARGAPRPALDAPEADAHRQTGFLLGAEVALLLQGLALEGAAATASAGARFRKAATTIVLATWSRSWLCRLQALHAIQAGTYPAVFPLVRSASEAWAAATLLLESGGHAFATYLADEGVRLAPEEHATEFARGTYGAAEVLARDEPLGRLYRLTDDLSGPHFGVTLLLAASESRPDRVLATFGDRDFHLGLAEVGLGCLLEFGINALATAGHYPTILGGEQTAEVEDWVDAAGGAVSRPDRCTAVRRPGAGEARIVVSNWRRAPGGAPRRIVL